MTTSAKVRMVAASRQMYAGRSLRIGDLFEVDSEAEAADLEVMRFAVRDKTTRPSPKYETKVVEPVEGVKVLEEKPRERYNRRDLRASK